MGVPFAPFFHIQFSLFFPVSTCCFGFTLHIPKRSIMARKKRSVRAEAQYVVDAILDHRWAVDGTIQYRTKWEGYVATSWEPTTSHTEESLKGWKESSSYYDLGDFPTSVSDPKKRKTKSKKKTSKDSESGTVPKKRTVKKRKKTSKAKSSTSPTPFSGLNLPSLG